MTKIVVALLLAASLLSNVHAQEYHHEHQAPHKGTLIVLCKEFAHVELVLDKISGLLTAYILDGEAETAVALPQEDILLAVKLKNGKSSFNVTLHAVENPLTGEMVGHASQFQAEVPALKETDSFSGEIKAITIKEIDFDHVTFDFPEGNEHE